MRSDMQCERYKMNNPERTQAKWNGPRSRAVLAPEDFNLLREAVQHYIMESGVNLDEEKHRKFSSLYHRLTRV